MKLGTLFLLTFLSLFNDSLFAESPPAADGHDSFIKGLKEIKSDGAESASKPRTLSPVVSRFKGWFIDVTEKAKPGKLDGVDVVDGISPVSYTHLTLPTTPYV